MEIANALDWLNVIVEVSVGIYVFFVSIPALIHSAYVPQELRDIEMRDNYLKGPFGFIVLIIALSSLHFFAVEIFPQKLDWIDNCFYTTYLCHLVPEVKNIFSISLTLIISLLFLFMLRSVRPSKIRMKPGQLEEMVDSRKQDILQYYDSKNSKTGIWRKFKSRRSAKVKIEGLWTGMVRFGSSVQSGNMKMYWLESMREIIVSLGESRADVEGLKTALLNLKEVMISPNNKIHYGETRYTLNIFRELISILKSKEDSNDKFDLAECYGVISNALAGLGNNAIIQNKPELLPTLVNTITMLPFNPAPYLFEITNKSLKEGNYEILGYALNEIVGRGEPDVTRQHNFMGIYAALCLKGGAFQQHADRMRANSGYPEPNKELMKNAYDYHFANAHFDVADSLYHLIEEKYPKKPAKPTSPRKPRTKKNVA